MEQFVSLHKYWLTADAIKQIVKIRIGEDSSLSSEVNAVAEQYSSFLRLSVYYSLIFVVLEGYWELKCSDTTIDDLLSKQDYVSALKLFRNATFHYQKSAIPNKLIQFIELKESEIWIIELHSAIRKYLEDKLKIKETILSFTQ